MTVSVKRGSAEVLDALYRLLLKHGKPEDIRSDNGPDLIAASLHKGLIKIGIKPIRITPGSSWENGDNERFNGRLCREGLNAEGVNEPLPALHRRIREGLNAEGVNTTRQAQIVINQGLRQYNHIRPHQALNQPPPSPQTLSGTGT